MPIQPSPPFALRDPLTGLVRIDPLTLGVAAALARGSAGPVTATLLEHFGELVEAGLATETSGGGGQPELDPSFAALASVVAAAATTAQVQRFVGADTHTATVLQTADQAVLVDHHADGTCSIAPLAVGEVAGAVGDFVAFDPLRTEAATGRLALAPVALDRFHARLVAGDGPAAAAVLSTSGLGREELALLLDLVLGRCHSWRVLTATGALVVVDGGSQGLWCSGRAHATGSATDFSPVRAPALWDALRSMLRLDDCAMHAA